MVTRRTMLKTGLLGGALLAAGGLASSLLGRDPRRDRDTVLRAMIPAVLAGALPPADATGRAATIGRCADAVGVAIGGLAPATQAELAQLFSLLAAAPTRWLTTGLSSWEQATPEDVAEVLQRWRLHRLVLLQSAYHAIHDLVTAAWYGDESTWFELGYGGPLRL